MQRSVMSRDKRDGDNEDKMENERNLKEYLWYGCSCYGCDLKKIVL